MTAKSERRQTLRGRFLRITIPLIFLSVIGVFTVIEVIAHRNAVERLQHTLEANISTQAAALATPVWNLDDDQIRLSLAAIVTNPEILAARVLGEDGEVMGEAGAVDPAQGDTMTLQRTIVFDAGAGPKTIGTLQFVATPELVWQQTRNRLLIAAAIALVAVSIEVAAALYALRSIIGRPLERLLASINRARSGDDPQPVEWASSDELGQVIGAYNEMQSRQAAYEKELRDARDKLEDRVEERTAALAAARDDATRAQQRLIAAIETIGEGFSLYDADDRLVISNTRYREMLHASDDSIMKQGAAFETVLRTAIERGFIADAEVDAESWLAGRLARHRDPGAPHVQRYANGKWVRVSERQTADGGTVAVYSDITELKHREEELANKSAQLEQLSNQLAKYLSPQVYESIFAGRQEVKISASRKKLTVFFSDIADFTETADRLESEELTHLLNHYLTEMSQIALRHGATIDKYVGDAILIFFGDPETRGVREDALACVRMAIAMRERLRELQGMWRDSGITRPLQCRMGIHTDYCTVGNFGSEDRLDYTIIGRGVNMASRLESQAKPGEILISGETRALVSEEVVCEQRGEIEVKGIAYPITTFEVVGLRDDRQDPAPHDSMLSGALLQLEPQAMSAERRRAAVVALRQALARLERHDQESDAAE
ncbi:MAG: adenylate/guanylate cyclase domain-containing protein [Pseudomonadota bacterium]